METTTTEYVPAGDVHLFYDWRIGTAVMGNGDPALVLTLTDGETGAREDYGMTPDGARELADKLRSEAAEAEAGPGVSFVASGGL
jgi:hypothetical protein